MELLIIVAAPPAVAVLVGALVKAEECLDRCARRALLEHGRTTTGTSTGPGCPRTPVTDPADARATAATGRPRQVDPTEHEEPVGALHAVTAGPARTTRATATAPEPPVPGPVPVPAPRQAPAGVHARRASTPPDRRIRPPVPTAVPTAGSEAAPVSAPASAPVSVPGPAPAAASGHGGTTTSANRPGHGPLLTR